MSANLLEGIEPKLGSGTAYADGAWLIPANATDKDANALDFMLAGLSALAGNQTCHVGASLRAAKGAAVYLWAGVEYKDSAGNVNYTGCGLAARGTGGWQRVEGSIVVPSGMTIGDFFVHQTGGRPAVELASPTLSYGTSGPILASDSHTPYATQDHVAAEYATKAQLKVDEDKITSEVGERTKLGGRVGTLESTSSEHATKITQLSSSIESMVKGEATYTAPDGTTKTSGIYSKIEQTSSGINKTFGSYTKTEDMQSQISAAQSAATSAANSATDSKLASYTKTADLASTAAVKDAKKAGTDAASAASAAQSTADTAKANAATAQTTANTAVTNASTAQSTANSAKSTADNLATLIHEGEDGITVGKSADGKTFTQGRTRMGQNSFDVLDADGNILETTGKNGLDVKSSHGWECFVGDIGAEKGVPFNGGIWSNQQIGMLAPDGTTFYDTSSDNGNLVDAIIDERGVHATGLEVSADTNISGTRILKVFAGTSVVKSLGSDFDLFSGDDCKSRFGELVMPDEHASWVLLASPGQGSYDHHITLSPTSSGGVHGYITPSVTGNVRVQWLFAKF